MNYMTPPKLFTPGPVDIFDETRAALGGPVPHMSDPRWLALYAETVEMLHTIMQTRNDIIVMTAPGSGAIETGLASLFVSGEEVVVVRNGMFAERIVQILTNYGCPVISVEGVWGEAIDAAAVSAALDAHPNAAGVAVVANETGTGVRNPVCDLAQLAHRRDLPIFVDAVSGMGGYDLPVDRWGLDVLATSSNKALEMAPGLGILSVSERAWAIIEAKEESARRGWYYNLATWKASRSRAAFPFPSTPPTLLIAGLHASLKRILEVETLTGHWARYAYAQGTVRRRLRELGFEMLAADAVASPTVTTVYKRREMESIDELRDYLLHAHNMMIATGGGPLTGQIARISHMGLAGTGEYVQALIDGVAAFVYRG
ncbi:MAG: alanine--glyoxylate aminotransferase family protein [Caldilineaceae bacterium]|nr:alanine--glyoxylate aminotransferase family protein [Caldilineaceae bacterium]